MDGSATTRLPRVAAGVAAVLALAAAVAVLVLAVRGDDGGRFHAGPFEPAPPSATAPFTAAAIGADPDVAAGSAAMVARALVPFADGANLAGSQHWGIPVVQRARPTRSGPSRPRGARCASGSRTTRRRRWAPTTTSRSSTATASSTSGSRGATAPATGPRAPR